MAAAIFALVFAYLWVGLLEAVDRFERRSPVPEYETAEPEVAAAPSFGRTLRIIFLFPFSKTIGHSTLHSLLKVLVHAGIVYAAAYGLALAFDHVVLGLVVLSVTVCLVAFFYILTSTTRLD